MSYVYGRPSYIRIIDRVVSLFDHCTYAIKTDRLSEYVSRICTALVSMPKKVCYILLHDWMNVAHLARPIVIAVAIGRRGR